MSHSRFIELLAKKESGEITLMEQKELSDAIAANEKFAILANTLSGSYQELAPFNNISEESLESKWQKLSEKIKVDAKRGSVSDNFVKIYRPLLVAASIIAVVAVSVLAYLNLDSQKSSENRNIVSTKKGSKSNVVLPDGTQVWLNADSKITYEKSFGTTTREVVLSGEAFFDVTHDASKPFIVHTGKADIKVLGTTFNVRNYGEDNYIEAALVKGKIEVVLKDHPANRIVLNPSEKITIKKDAAINNTDKKEAVKSATADIFTLAKITQKDSVIAETSWVQNKQVFINKPLVDIVSDLERQFNISANFKSKSVKNYRYTIYTDNLTLEEILQMLKTSKNFNYHLKGTELTIE